MATIVKKPAERQKKKQPNPDDRDIEAHVAEFRRLLDQMSDDEKVLILAILHTMVEWERWQLGKK